MSTFALFRPNDLLATELREQLDRRPELWRELRLLAADDDEVGQLAELAGGATFVRPADAEGLRGVDLLFSCAPWEATAPLAGALVPNGTVVMLGERAPDAIEVVAGVNDEVATRGGVLATPPPELIHLALLLGPLRRFDLAEAVATTMLPVSSRGRACLDAMLDQTRDILSFRGVGHQAELQGQRAFNLRQGDPGSSADATILRRILGCEVGLAVQRLEAGVFHSVATSLHVRFHDDPDPEDVIEALAEGPFLQIDREIERLGPVDVAGHEEVLVSLPVADPDRPGAFWIWSVMDNLTRGGASNALAIAERLVAS